MLRIRVRQPFNRAGVPKRHPNILSNDISPQKTKCDLIGCGNPRAFYHQYGIGRCIDKSLQLRMGRDGQSLAGFSVGVAWDFSNVVGIIVWIGSNEQGDQHRDKHDENALSCSLHLASEQSPDQGQRKRR